MQALSHGCKGVFFLNGARRSHNLSAAIDLISSLASLGQDISGCHHNNRVADFMRTCKDCSSSFTKYVRAAWPSGLSLLATRLVYSLITEVWRISSKNFNCSAIELG